MKRINQISGVVIILISTLTLFARCGKEELNIENKEDFEAYLEEEMSIQAIPAMSVLVFKEEHVLYEHYFGKSNIEKNIALKQDHLFLLASISKVITATALLQLYEAGQFALEDNINDYLPFKVEHPDYSTKITFQMLLTHTASIGDGSALDEQYYYGRDSPIKLFDYLKSYLVSGGLYYNSDENFYDFEPGRDYEYSNTGNALIGALVEVISGKDFNTYCKENIFLPLKMSNTFWRLEEISQPIVQPYEYGRGEFKAIEHYTFTDYPNGGLRSTSRDLFLFLSTLAMQGKMSNGDELLKAETVRKMITPQIPSIDREVGLHLFLFSESNNLWGHDGGEEGVATIMAFNPVTKVGAIVLANEGEAYLDEILEEAYKIGLKL